MEKDLQEEYARWKLTTEQLIKTLYELQQEVDRWQTIAGDILMTLDGYIGEVMFSDEPWLQPIYDEIMSTEDERRERRANKEGNS